MVNDSQGFRDHKNQLDRLASGKWQEILQQLGVPALVVTPKKPQPCPKCGGNDRFSFTDKYQRGDAHCRVCGHLDAFAIADACGVPFMRVINHLEEYFGIKRDSRSETRQAPTKPYFLRIWEAAKPLVIGDCGYDYLLARGLNLSTLPSSLRLHPSLEYKDDADVTGSASGASSNIRKYFPALLALVRDRDGKPIAVQRIYLDGAGGKAPVDNPKKAVGQLNQGGAVRLRTISDHMGIAEGMETAEAAFELYGIPTWASCTAGNLAKFEVPDGVVELTIFGDIDLSFAGQAAVFALAHRLYKKVKVNIVWPGSHASSPFRDIDFLNTLNSTKTTMLHNVTH